MKDILFTFIAMLLIWIAITLQEFRTEALIDWVFIVQVVLVVIGINIYKYLID